MNIRLKTNSDMEQLLIELQSNLQLSSKAAVMRMAIGFSLKQKEDPRLVCEKYDSKIMNGQDYLRLTILGNDDTLYKLIMEEHLGSYLKDEDYFPELVFAHINRGLKILNSEYKYARNKESFYKKILEIKD